MRDICCFLSFSKANAVSRALAERFHTARLFYPAQRRTFHGSIRRSDKPCRGKVFIDFAFDTGGCFYCVFRSCRIQMEPLVIRDRCLRQKNRVAPLMQLHPSGNRRLVFPHPFADFFECHSFIQAFLNFNSIVKRHMFVFLFLVHCLRPPFLRLNTATISF